jgi:hypothetical protein
MATVHEIVIAHDKYVTATVAAYKTRLDELVRTATARTLAALAQRLALDKNGNIARTAANARVLKSVDTIFASEMDRAGYDALNAAYAGQFAGQLPYLDQILDQLSAQMKTPLPDVRDVLRGEDKRALAAQQSSAVESLSTVVDVVAAGAKRQALFGFAGLSVADLSATLAKAFGRTQSAAESIADTAQVAWYRTVTDQAFEAIEADLPQMKLLYEYEGPLDKLNRPKCRLWMEQMIAGKRWTREDVDALDNGPGQPKPVKIYGGGIRCRHQIMLSV